MIISFYVSYTNEGSPYVVANKITGNYPVIESLFYQVPKVVIKVYIYKRSKIK
jgi:hypothetical protein